jgi:cytochrome c oxidase cbb3-type subunit 2
VLTAVAVSIGGLAEIIPLMLDREVTAPAEGVVPYSALELEGRDIYIREGCYACHSQMIRPFRAETERYGAYSQAGETVYDHPFQFGSKRTGPDLARVGGRYSDEWHRVHLLNPRDADISGASAAVEDKTEMDAVIAYLQGLGTAVSGR